jgi:hypothetical protein
MRPAYLDKVLGLSEGELSSELSEDSHSKDDQEAQEEDQEAQAEDQEAQAEDRKARRRLNRYRIPKVSWGKVWSKDLWENLRKNCLHFKNFADSVLRNATLSELKALAKQSSGSRLLSQVLSELLQKLSHKDQRRCRWLPGESTQFEVCR